MISCSCLIQDLDRVEEDEIQKLNGLYTALANELIAETPENWSSFSLVVTNSSDDEYRRESYKIQPISERSEPISPSDEMMSLVPRIFELGDGSDILRFEFELNERDDGTWKYEATFDRH